MAIRPARDGAHWAARRETHAELRAWHEATVERERIALTTARHRAAHFQRIAEALDTRLCAVDPTYRRKRPASVKADV
jgi:hypothetical protein